MKNFINYFKLKKKMELKLNEQVIVIILSFLCEISLRNYDSALTEKEKRIIYIECLTKLRCINLHINRWTNLRKITNNLQYVNYKNIKYISNCEKIIVYTKNEYEKSEKIINIDINNDNIEYIHIDFDCKIISINNTISIKSKKLKKILFVGKYINDINFLKNLIEDCPKLNTIKFISCTNTKLYNNIIEFKKDQNLKIIIYI